MKKNTILNLMMACSLILASCSQSKEEKNEIITTTAEVETPWCKFQ